MFFFFKQKTAYEMRISDWSSDVCSSDLQLSEAAARCDATGDRIVTLRPLSSYHPPPGRRAPRRPVRRSLLGEARCCVATAAGATPASCQRPLSDDGPATAARARRPAPQPARQAQTTGFTDRTARAQSAPTR